MAFVVIVFTCIVSLHGQNCKPWQEDGIPQYSTYQECERHARAMAENIKVAGVSRWQMQLPNEGDHVKVKAFCLVPIIDEIVLG